MQHVTEFRLWPGKAPLAIGDTPDDVPTVTFYRPELPTSRGCVLILPGGGYAALVDHEKTNIAAWITGLGLTAGIVKYRIAPRYRHPAPLTDACRAVRFTRAHAEDLGIDPTKIGVIGFSAGGHLSAHVATTSIASGETGDPVEKQSSRPDVSLLVYPVISFKEEHGHVGSRNNLLGPNFDPALKESLSLYNAVTATTPPTFIFHGWNDTVVPPIHSLLYAQALAEKKVPAEVHLYEKAQHGCQLAPNDPVVHTWTDRCRDWFVLHGLLPKATTRPS